jgi:hypothetical protein
MSNRPQTIQIFLPTGNPQGIRIAELTTRIVQVVEVPRSLVGEFSAMPESRQVAVYFLVGEDPDGERQVYIGQTGSTGDRFASHNRDAKKDFWEKALVVISKTNSLTQTHALFLEWHCLNECRKAGRFPDVNGTAGSRPHTPAPLEADCLEIFDTARTLLATLGYPVFAPVAKEAQNENEAEIYYCQQSGADGRGQYTSEGFVVLKGSVARIENTPSLGQALERKRHKMLEEGIFTVEGDKWLVTKDFLVNSPSMAAIILMGRRANGWTEWRDEAGRTLDELKRQ